MIPFVFAGGELAILLSVAISGIGLLGIGAAGVTYAAGFVVGGAI